MHSTSACGASLTLRQRILIVVAVPMTVKAFLMTYIRKLSESYDVTVACSDAIPDFQQSLPLGVHFIPIEIARQISPWRDLLAVFRLVRLIRAGRFSLVHSVTPKAGLLTQLAAFWCGVSVRIHTFTGQVWVTRRGPFRWLLKTLDRLIAACATRLLADSASQRDFLVAQGIVSECKIDVLGHGSISGVDPARFRPNPEVRKAIRYSLGYGEEMVFALYVGRINRDKGVLDLVAAFAGVAERLPQLALLLVGPDEENLAPEIARLALNHPRLHLLGATPRPEDFMAAADFFCLPSYREGFGSVVIEAAACGIPAMVSDIYGLTDAVADGESGVLHPPTDVSSIAACLERLTVERDWCVRLGEQARRRAQQQFSSEIVVLAQMNFVNQLLGQERS
jgi:glycosyltransferase involved in cell wall biosynthesis